MSEPHPIAIAVSDLHLSLVAPACRAEKDWLAVQAGYLQQLKDNAGDLPILCAGDIFDRWNPSPELITFALKELPNEMLCVPGQHDLPNHRLDGIHRSGYGVLVQAGKITDISQGNRQIWKDSFVACGFGWGEEIKPQSANQVWPRIAVIHRYCWIDGKSFPDAPQECRLDSFTSFLRGFATAVIGDNHKGFLAKAGDCTVLNCGGFMRRKSDEIDYEPRIGIIYSDGTVKRRRLDTSGDKFHEAPAERSEVAFDMKAFLEGLEGLGEHGLDFRQAVENHLKTEDIDPEVKQIITAALDAAK